MQTLGVIDTGCETTCMSYKFYKKLYDDGIIEDLVRDKGKFTAADNKPIKNYGSVNTEIMIKDITLYLKVQVLELHDSLLIGSNFLNAMKKVFGSYTFMNNYHQTDCQQSTRCSEYCVNGPVLIFGDKLMTQGPVRARVVPIVDSKGRTQIIKVIKKDNTTAKEDCSSNKSNTKTSVLMKKDIESIKEYYEKVLPILKGTTTTDLGKPGKIEYTLDETSPKDVGKVYGLDNDEVDESKLLADGENLSFIEINHTGVDKINRIFKIGHGFKKKEHQDRLKVICQKYSRVFNLDGNFFPCVNNFYASSWLYKTEL